MLRMLNNIKPSWGMHIFLFLSFSIFTLEMTCLKIAHFKLQLIFIVSVTKTVFSKYCSQLLAGLCQPNLITWVGSLVFTPFAFSFTQKVVIHCFATRGCKSSWLTLMFSVKIAFGYALLRIVKVTVQDNTNFIS